MEHGGSIVDNLPLNSNHKDFHKVSTLVEIKVSYLIKGGMSSGLGPSF